MELPNDVRAFIEQNFPSDQWEDAFTILCQARIEDGTMPSPRLLRCAVFASDGSLTQLRSFATHLAIDWRDVILAGEYELRDTVAVQVRDLTLPLQV